MALLTIALLLAPFAVAQDAGNERELKAAMQRVKELLRKAEELHERGSHEDARELRNKAEELKAKINAAQKKSKKWKSKSRSKQKGGHDLHRVMNDLEAGMRALRRLGGHKELLAHLERVAANLHEKMAKGRRERKHDDGKRGGAKQREVAKQQLELMRAAMGALMKRDKRDSAELMEHAIHAMELRLEGRRDEKATGIIRRAPKAGAMFELLMISSEILADMGKRDLAHAVAKLAKQYRKREGDKAHKGRVERLFDFIRDRDRKQRERKGRAHNELDRRGRGGEHRERNHGEHLERIMERVERLEKRFDDIAGLLERLLKQRDR